MRWSNPSTRRRCRRLSTPSAVLVQSHKQLPRQLVENSGATTPGFLGPFSSTPSCFESSSFRWSVFGSPPLCDARSVFGSPPLRSFHHCPVPAFPLTHSPRREVVSGAGSHEGCPLHGFWASQNGGVVSAVVPCGSEATLSQRGWNNNSYPTISWLSSSTPKGGERTTSLPRDSARRDAYVPVRPSHSGIPTPWASPQAHAARVYVYGCVVDGIQLRIPQCEEDNLRRSENSSQLWLLGISQKKTLVENR